MTIQELYKKAFAPVVIIFIGLIAIIAISHCIWMVRQATVWDAQKIAELWGKLVDEVAIEGREGSIEEQERFFLSLLVRIKKVCLHKYRNP